MLPPKLKLYNATIISMRISLIKPLFIAVRQPFSCYIYLRESCWLPFDILIISLQRYPHTASYIAERLSASFLHIYDTASHDIYAAIARAYDDIYIIIYFQHRAADILSSSSKVAHATPATDMYFTTIFQPLPRIMAHEASLFYLNTLTSFA